jgi:hypothetical protein
MTMNSVTLPTMTPVVSSHIAAIGHDAAHNALHVRFKDSGHYVYENAPADLYQHFVKADSAGKFFIQYVKGKFPDRKIMNVKPVEASNPREAIGGNNPPEPIEEEAATDEDETTRALVSIESARDCYRLLAAFLADTPVIENPGDAKKAANFVEQARRTIGTMEDERKLLVGPLNEEVKEINDRYRTPRDCIEKILDELKRRLTAFAAAEEAKRQREAEAAREAAEEAERAAREAEAIESDAKAMADVGVCDVNVAAAIAQADRAFDGFKRADRAAVRAEASIPVRLNGGYGRAVSMRKTETLILDDACAAIAAIGLTDTIRDAILSAARAYRKLNGSLPAGVSAVTERQF